MPRQLSFDLPVREALGREDFFVSPANAGAVAMIEAWPDWPSRKLLLTGPEGAGKTHLAQVWAGLSQGRVVGAAELSTVDVPTLAQGPVAVEDADRIAGSADAEQALFHLHNLTLAEGHSMLITARTPPARWGLTLPDLASRMQGTTQADLELPDDTLLGAVLMKLMADRQLRPTFNLIPFLVRRIDRSFRAASEIVERLDNASLEQGAPINTRFAAKLLEGPEHPS